MPPTPPSWPETRRVRTNTRVATRPPCAVSAPSAPPRGLKTVSHPCCHPGGLSRKGRRDSSGLWGPEGGREEFSRRFSGTTGPETGSSVGTRRGPTGGGCFWSCRPRSMNKGRVDTLDCPARAQASLQAAQPDLPAVPARREGPRLSPTAQRLAREALFLGGRAPTHQHEPRGPQLHPHSSKALRLPWPQAPLHPRSSPVQLHPRAPAAPRAQEGASARLPRLGSRHCSPRGLAHYQTLRPGQGRGAPSRWTWCSDPAG